VAGVAVSLGERTGRSDNERKRKQQQSRFHGHT